MGKTSKLEKQKLDIPAAKDLEEAEIIAERKNRVLLVIKARWAITALYIVYGLVSALWLFSKTGTQSPARSFYLFALGLIFLVVYNGFLHYSYERLSRFRSIAQVQMIIDVLMTTLVIHFTGGPASWFWSTYLLIILQSAFLFDRKIETMEIALLSGLSFSLLTILERFGIFGPFNPSLVIARYSNDPGYSGLIVFWVIASTFVVAVIASYFMGIIRQKERYLRHKSITDGLTGLYNHSHFHKRLVGEIDRAKRYKRTLSLILIDLDDFKQYNDTYGHLAGDKILRDIAFVFNKNMRNELDTVYRYGGEEFAIIAPETASQELGVNKAGAIALAERIRTSIEEHLPISISVGISSYPHHAEEPSKLFKAADLALYRAKEKGKNCSVIYSSALSKKQAPSKIRSITKNK